ncbi:MAG: discoidin domain-containing protein [Gemmatimonadales bacterium]|nr:discoidin domain-containing protein [Gemmatimonadales bacterium]
MTAAYRRGSWPRWGTVALLAALGCGAPPLRLIDRQATFDRFGWWDNRDWDWYDTNIPFFESPDSAIDATYYYRWELVTKHLTYGSPTTGYVFTEFLDRPFWSGTYGAISCPLGHQFYEVRWLKDRRIVEDYARYWFETPGAEPRRYSNWYGDAMWAVYQVTGDTAFLRAVLPHMEQQYDGWMQEHFDAEHGMFRWVGAWDGMETNINSRQTDDAFSGAEGYRPTLNSYLYADALAISKTARLVGDTTRAADYAARAAALKQRVQDELWDPEREFFFHQFAHDERDGIEALSLTYRTGKYAGNPHGREEIGFVPWQFGLPGPQYERAWQFLMDPEYFLAPFGPTTVERHDPLFYVSPRCCEWSGNSWPYATTQTLVAMANLLNDYEQEVVDRADFVELLRIYTRTQRKDGRPYIAEAANPDNGSWEGHDTRYHSEHYFHSAYVDLIVTGLVGLRPRDDEVLEVSPLVPDDWDYFALDGIAYRGHDVAIAWDRTGRRYGRGKGLMVFVDGRKLASAPNVKRLTAVLPAATPVGPLDRMHNFAVSNDGDPFPLVSASFAAPAAPPFYAVDGNYWYHTAPANRWTTVGSPNAEDWITVDFGVERQVETVKLSFLDDGAGVTAPASYALQAWVGGDWREIGGQRRRPAKPEGHRANVVSFPTLETSRIRAVLAHRAGSASGLTEIEAWGHAVLPLSPPMEESGNVARDGAVAAASFTSPYDDVAQVIDGRIAFARYSRNRWTAYGSPNASDWVTLDFGAPRRVTRVDLYLWGDGGGVLAPRDYRVEYRDGTRWRRATVLERRPVEPTTWALNTVTIEPVETQAIRVVFEHALPAFSGMTELEVW